MLESVPVLKSGISIREFDTSYEKKTYILSLEGRNWQVTEFVHDILVQIDGIKNIKQIFSQISDKYGEKISEADIYNIIYKNFAEKGLMEGQSQRSSTATNRSRLLWCKISLIKSEWISKFKFLAVLYNPYIFRALITITSVIPLLLVFKFINVTQFQKLMQFSGSDVCYFFGIALLAVLAHEFGHMAAVMRFNIEPGDIGFAFYFMQPVMYSDVTRVWILSRKQRVLIDIGGVYFECIFLSILGAWGYLTGNSFIKLATSMLAIGLTFNFNPFIKLDGYWMVSDLLGIPNLHAKMNEFLKGSIYSLAGIKVNSQHNSISRKERLIFYGYTFFCMGFVAFMAYGFVTFFLSMIADYRRFVEIFHFHLNGNSYAETVMGVLIKLYHDLVYIISILLFMRFIYVIFKSAAKSIKGFIYAYQ